MAAAVGLGAYALADNGTLVYRPGTSGVGRTLVWVTREGRTAPVAGLEPDQYYSVRISPDGRNLALSLERSRRSDIWTLDIARGARTRITTTPDANERLPLWTKDGESLVFESNRHGPPELFRQRVDGTGAAELLLHRGDDLRLLQSPTLITIRSSLGYPF